jgi:hypothetical protein
MHQSVSIAVLIALSGCAGPLERAASPAPSVVEAGETSAAGAASSDGEIAIVKQVEISPSRQDQSHCEDLTRPGSRIVVARRCGSIDEEAIADQINQVRSEQDMLDRLARERESRRGGL